MTIHNSPQDSATAPTDEHGIPANLHKPSTWTVLAVCALFGLLLVGLFFLGRGPHERAAAEIRADASSESQAPTVYVVNPRPTSATTALVLPCDVRANQETAIFARSNGYLKKLYVDIQDKVTAGQLLAEIDSPEIDAQHKQAEAVLEQTRASVVRALADLALAKSTLARYQAVLSPGLVTTQELDEKLAARDQAAANVVLAQANVGAAAADAERLVVLQSFEKITAPFAGTITARNADVGALLSPTNAAGRELFRIVDSATLRVFVSVPQVNATEIRTGQPALLTVRNYPGRTFEGTVARIASALDPATRTMPFELHFANNSDRSLYPGMYGQVSLPLSNDRPTLTVPTSALVFNTQGAQIVLVQNRHIHLQIVKVGRDLGTELEILSNDLAAGDQVVVTPTTHLVEGLEVEPRPQPLVPTASPATRPAAPTTSTASITHS